MIAFFLPNKKVENLQKIFAFDFYKTKLLME